MREHMPLDVLDYLNEPDGLKYGEEEREPEILIIASQYIADRKSDESNELWKKIYRKITEEEIVKAKRNTFRTYRLPKQKHIKTQVEIIKEVEQETVIFETLYVECPFCHKEIALITNQPVHARFFENPTKLPFTVRCCHMLNSGEFHYNFNIKTEERNKWTLQVV
jgi:hypothetical protein